MNSRLNSMLLVFGQKLPIRNKGHFSVLSGIKHLKDDKKGFGMSELLGIAAALIIAAFVIIPGLRGFAGTLMSNLTEWWEDTIAAKMFPTV